MSVAIISFTQQGNQTAEKIKMHIQNITKDEIKTYFGKGISLKDWTKVQFERGNDLIYVGACGIAVRSISPFLKSKWTDPAVLVVDEKGHFVIPIVSGHVGGGNDLARVIAKAIDGTAVITTATDINEQFSVDVFAKKNQLYIKDKEKCKLLASHILHGGKVKFISKEPIQGKLPDCFTDTKDAFLLYVGKEAPDEQKNLLWLYPSDISIGIGCRKNISEAKIEEAINDMCKKYEIDRAAIKGLYSIDLKKEEQGIISYCKKNELSFTCFNKEELEAVTGSKSVSEFVKNVTGVDNVCERSAILGSNYGQLLVEKKIYDGVTLAIAKGRQAICFDE